MTTYTHLETITYNAIFDTCHDELGASIDDMSKGTGQTAKVLRGVIASLVKKDMITIVHDEDGLILFAPYNASNGECFTWGGESLTQAQSDSFVELT